MVSHLVCSSRFPRLLVRVLTVSLVITTAHTRAQQLAAPTEAELRSIVYDDNIPGFHAMPAVRGGTGPLVELSLAQKDGSIAGRIEGHWYSNDGLNAVEVRVSIYPSSNAAIERALEFVDHSADPHRLMDPADCIGERSWIMQAPSGSSRLFTVGRVLAWVSMRPTGRLVDPRRDLLRVSVLDADYEAVVNTLARGLEWMIRQRPELVAQSDPADCQSRTSPTTGSGTGVPALAFGNATWAPLAVLQRAGAKVAWEQKSNRATVTYRGKRLALRTCHNDAILNSKRKIDLGARVLLSNEGPIVPIQKVAEALGIKVTITPKTVRIG